MSQNSQILDRQSVLCPQQVCIGVGSKLNDLKMSYLVIEKADLEIELIELKQNNAMLRDINSQISLYSPTDVSVLLRRNQELEQSISKLGKQVKRIRAELFLVNQISAQDENEQRQIYKNYEDKILELRRAVHDKEISIQELETKISGKTKKDTFAFPQKFVLDYSQLVSQAKQELKQTQKENQQLKEQTKTLRQQNQKLSNKLTKMESLLKSKYSYLDFRNSMNEKSSKSNPKHNSYFLQSKIQKNDNSYSTFPRIDVEKQNLSLSCRQRNDSFFYLARQDIATVDKVIKIIRKKMNIIENLEHKNRNLIKVNEIYVAELSQLRNSNQFYQKQRKQTYDKANLSKIAASKMLNYISKRESSKYLFERACEYQDKDNQLKLLGIKVKTRQPVLLSTALLKTEWQNSKRLLEQKIKSLKAEKKQRSYSCIIDYILSSELALVQNNVNDLNFGETEDGLLLTQEQEKKLQPIKSIAKIKKGNLCESFSMFENVLLDF